MMVRLDKILHMITCFKSVTSGLEDDQYSVPPENIEISTSSARVMKRMGAVSTHIDIKLNKKKIISSIPYGRELFLFDHLKRFSKNTCRENNPECDSCNLNAHCDFHNKKNDWVN
tara:strand:+ start:1156 stop:1500 length:345 start_codon:yes stop_codon:yes gene_type:complete